MSTMLVPQRSLAILHKSELLFKFTKTLINRKSKYDAKNSTAYNHLMQSQNYHQKIVGNFSLMQKSLKQSRLEIAREYRKRKAQGYSPQNLRALVKQSQKLQKLDKEIELARQMYMSPKAPKLNPLAAVLPSVPADKIIMDKKTLDSFVRTAIQKGWSAAETTMQQFVKLSSPGQFKLTDVKQQVCDELMRLKIADVIEREPEDKSHNRSASMRK